MDPKTLNPIETKSKCRVYDCNFTANNGECCENCFKNQAHCSDCNERWFLRPNGKCIRCDMNHVDLAT